MPPLIDHEQRREEVGEAALRVIARDGVAGATIRAIASEAEMSTSWITHYFDDHDEVILQAVEQLRRFTQAWRGSLEGLPPAEALRAMLVATSSGHDQAAAGRALLHLTTGPLPAATRAEVADLEKWCTAQLDDQIGLAIDEGYEGPPDRQAAAADLHAMVLGLRQASMADPEVWSGERIEDSIDRALSTVLGRQRDRSTPP